MSSRNEIPLNKKPKNGLSAFFTEASFYTWLEKESHESRLAANLEKFCKGFIVPKQFFDNKEEAQHSTSASTSTESADKMEEEHNFNASDENTTDYQIDGMEVKPETDTENIEKSATTRNETLDGNETCLAVSRDEDVSNKKQPDSSDGAKSSPNKDQPLNELEKKKQAMETNKLFYNDQDRKDKYLPILGKKRPRGGKPTLSVQEQKLYLDMKRRFAKLDTTQLNLQQQTDYKMFKALAHKVETEQQKFMKQLRYAFTQCGEDYKYIHAEVEKYVNDKLLAKRKRVTELPRFYYPGKRIELTDYVTDQQPMLTYVKPLLQLGTVPWMVLPQIVSGLPQPCIPTCCKKVEKVYPNVRNVVKGQCVWDHEVCSQDVNAEQLAVPNRCNFVMSSSVIKHLVDNQGFTSKLWNIPIVVKEYNIKEGDKTITHKVVYLDKPLVKPNQICIRDKHKLYQKYALRSVAIRENHKPHVFCNTRPSSEVAKYVTLEEVYREMEEFDNRIMSDMPSRAIYNLDSPDECNLEEKETKNEKRKDRRRARKRGSLDVSDAVPAKKGVGLFDLENEIDDLETFGGDMSWKASSKFDKNLTKNFVKSPTGKKGSNSDLEMFKQELEGLKSNALKKGLKSPVDKNATNTSTTSTENQNARIESDKEQTASSNKVLPSLSEKLKQMSNIRSKLNLKTLQTQFVPSSTNPTQVSSSGDTIDKSINNQTVVDDTKKDSQDKQKDQHKVRAVVREFDSESDSDQSDDGLVIDMPASADEAVASDASPNRVIAESEVAQAAIDGSDKPVGVTDSLLGMVPAQAYISVSKHSDTSPNKMSAKSEDAKPEDQLKHMNKDLTSTSSTFMEVCADSDDDEGLKIDEDHENDMETDGTNLKNKDSENEKAEGMQSAEDQNESQSVESDNIQSVGDNEQKPDSEEAAETSTKTEHEDVKQTSELDKDEHVVGVSTRGSKRKSVDKADEVGPVKKRGLRSSVTSNAESPHRHFTRHSTKRGASDDVNEQDEALKESNDKDETDVQPTKRISRSRTLSQDSTTIASTTSRRLTRQSGVDKEVSTDCDKETSEQQTQPKRRGRPPKKLTQIKIEETETESKKIKEMADIMKKKIADKLDSLPSVKADNDDKVVENDGNNKEAETAENLSGDIKDNNGENDENVVKKRQSKKTHKPSDVEEDKNSETSQQEVPKIKFYGTGSPEKTKTNEANGEKEEGSKNGADTCEKGEGLGLDNILNLQTKLLKSPDSKGTIRGSFAARHGMNTVVYPLKDNVTYHQWKLGDSNILLRCRYHGVANPQGLVHIATKMEYQPYFGFEKQFSNDIARNWISTYIRPNCTLVRARINPYNSEIMMMEYVEPKDLVPPDCLFRPNKAMADLQSVLEGLKDLPAGQYLLNNLRKKDHVCVFKAVPEGERGQFDLHYHFASNRHNKKGKETKMNKWVPIDTDLLLPHQKRMNLIPCTYNPNDAQSAQKPEEKKRSGKKKKKRNRRNQKENT